MGWAYLLKPSVTDSDTKTLRLTNETAVNMLAPKSAVWSKKRLVGTDVRTKGNAGQCRVDMLTEGTINLQVRV